MPIEIIRDYNHAQMILDDIAYRSLLSKGEQIKYVAHVHPFIMYPKWFKTMLLGIALPALFLYLMPPWVTIWLGWGALGVLVFMYQIMQWYLDAWVVTYHALIDQVWHSYFNKLTTRIEFGNVEGITTEIKGFWGAILRYGTLKIEHNSGTTIIIHNVANPKRVEAKIIQHQLEFNRRQNFEDHGKLRDLLTTMVRSYTKNP